MPDDETTARALGVRRIYAASTAQFLKRWSGTAVRLGEGWQEIRHGEQCQEQHQDDDGGHGNPWVSERPTVVGAPDDQLCFPITDHVSSPLPRRQR